MTSTTRRDFVKTLAAASVLAPEITNAAQAATPASDAAKGGRALPERFDYVIAGAGHNSLICAAYLSVAGYRVLVLEGQDQIGGGCKTNDKMLSGFMVDWCSTTHGLINRNPLLANNELKLEHYGYELLRPDVIMHYPFRDGASLTVFQNDVERTAATIALVSKKDAETFRRMAAARKTIAPTSPDGADKTRVQARFKTLSAMTGFSVARQIWDSPYMQAAAVSGGKFNGPSAAELGTGMQAFSMLDHLGGRPIPKGGSGMLTVALGRLIEANAGVILTSMPVTGILIEGGQCKGVECADGRKFQAKLGVISTLHAKHLLAMTPRALWGDAMADTVDLMQPEMAMFQFHFALTEPPRYPLAGGGSISTPEASIMENAANIFLLNEDDARGELHLDDYPLQVCHPSVFDTTRVPEGRGLVKIQGPMPYALKQGPEHWDQIKDEVADAVMARYMALTANLTKDKILAKMAFSPLDLERNNATMWRGSVHAFDNRPGNFVPYRLSIPGLYQTGSCTAPGGGISGLPGRNAAEAVLRDQGRDINQVIASAR